MRRWIRLATRLYPQAWRARYGEEFEALVEDAAADWRQLWDVTLGAFAMQLTNGITYLRVAGGLALAGSVLALAASYRVPQRYVSSAVVRIVPAANDNRPLSKDVLRSAAADRIRMLRACGHGLIQDTVRKERSHGNDADLFEDIEAHRDDVRIDPVELPGQNGLAVRVSFADADKEKARTGLANLVTEAQRFNENTNQSNLAFWKDVWHEPAPFSERLEVADPASLPAAPSGPGRWMFPAVGAAAGLVLGVPAVLFWRHRGAGLRVAALALAGFAVAAGLSLLVPERYTAKVAMRITAPNDPAHLSGEVAITPLSQWVERLRQEVVVPLHFVDMDREKAARLERVTREGRLGIRMQGAESATPFLEVTFSHPDRSTARFGAAGVAIAVITQYWSDLRTDTPGTGVLREARAHRAGEVIAVEDVSPPTATHYRWEARAAGALLGMLLSIVWKRRKTAPQTGGDLVWAAQ